jgi:hypothetical protein
MKTGNKTCRLVATKCAKRHWTANAAATLVGCAIVCIAPMVFAQAAPDLSAAFSEAETSIRSYLKIGIGVAGAVSVAVGIGLAGWKFVNKEPQAIWSLVGVVAGAALFVAAGNI